jgi:hypothetical protein
MVAATPPAPPARRRKSRSAGGAGSRHNASGCTVQGLRRPAGQYRALAHSIGTAMAMALAHAATPSAKWQPCSSTARAVAINDANAAAMILTYDKAACANLSARPQAGGDVKAVEGDGSCPLGAAR